MNRIKVPSTPNTIIQVTLSGRLYDIHFKYNNVDPLGGDFGRWYLDIYFSGRLIASSKKCVEYVNLLRGVNPEFLDGGLFVVKLQQTDQPCTRDNFGVGLAYELVYLPPKK